LRAIEARFVAPVYPGSVLDIAAGTHTDERGEAGTRFEVSVADICVLAGGRLRFG
jgi:acyl dehydratase